MATLKRKIYSKEFKLNAVKMITEEGHRTTEVSRNLQVSSNLLYSWKRTYLETLDNSFPGNGNLHPKDEYIRQLEQENKTLKVERDI